MTQDVRHFRTTIKIENPLSRGDKRSLPDTLVDTGAEAAQSIVAQSTR